MGRPLEQGDCAISYVPNCIFSKSSSFQAALRRWFFTPTFAVLSFFSRLSGVRRRMRKFASPGPLPIVHEVRFIAPPDVRFGHPAAVGAAWRATGSAVPLRNPCDGRPHITGSPTKPCHPDSGHPPATHPCRLDRRRIGSVEAIVSLPAGLPIVPIGHPGRTAAVRVG
jgi:hypothetical protein